MIGANAFDLYFYESDVAQRTQLNHVRTHANAVSVRFVDARQWTGGQRLGGQQLDE